MGYQVGRVYLHAVSTWSLSLGCCGYIFRAVFFSVSWDFVFFSFSLLRMHTAHCKYEATLPQVPLY